MKSTTKNLLRKAVTEALDAKDDAAAFELLGLLLDSPSQRDVEPAVPALPAACDVVTGPAHDYHHWAKFIREHFIPFMHMNGRSRFTSYELFSWMQNCGLLSLTTGDIETHQDGKPVWRNITSNALKNLKQQGIIHAPAWAKDYTIQTAKSVQGLLNGT
jgi:hypothetical protein